MKQQIILFFLAITLLLSGCNMNEQKQEKREVSILYSSIADFQRDFGFIESKFKNLSIKIIEFTPDLGQGIWNEMRFTPSQGGDWDSKSYIRLVKQYQPDILFFPQSIYSDLLSEGMLSDLSTYINEKDLDGITPSFIDTLKDMGNGRLYAVSDSISSQALFYNKDLFQQSNIPEPTDQMSWEQVFELAKGFSSQNNLSGLYLLNYDTAGLLLTMGNTDNLKWYDSLNHRTLFNSPAWRKHIDNLISFYQAGASYDAQEDPSELFLDGKLAMTLNNFSFVNKINNSHEKKINWGVVTEPVNLNEPNISKTMNFQYLNGVSVQAPNLEDSLEVWKYMNSEEAARLKNNFNLSTPTISVRGSLMKDDYNQNLKAFYKLQPQIKEDSSTLAYATKKEAIIQINNVLHEAIKGQLSIEQAILKLQEDVTDAIQSNKE